MALMSPWTVKGCVYRNVLPNWFEDELPYQVVNALFTWMGTCVVCKLPCDEAVKRKSACVTCRAVEKPLTRTSKPPLVLTT